ncbi:MAG: AlkA N-terminal domain-containing protein [Gemmatimonadales bacterium]
MTSDPAALYNAFVSRDPRFDGVFYVGVTSTGIYCRPVCTARTPRAANCRFFASAEAAEKARFRPCLRCRPELAPGNAPVDDSRRIAGLVAQRIDEGMLDDGAGLEAVAAKFGWSSRQIRRMVQKELGVSPIELVLTRRLLLAKQLLTETTLPIAQVALASGFSSLRRFDDAFGGRYGMPPSRFRRATDDAAAVAESTDTFTLRLSYRPPFDWGGLLRFLGARALKGVESVRDGEYLRTISLGDHAGWIRVTDVPAKRSVAVELTHSLTPVLPALLGRLRHLFDLAARPDLIAAHLADSELLAAAVSENPGLRVPGAFDGFELAMRAILGQQVTVKGATTIAGRVVAAFGEPIATPHRELRRLSPTPERIAAIQVEELASLGIVRTRAESVIALAREIAAGRLVLDAGADPARTMERLVALPGIGAWTAQYVAMRALRWPDAFPKEDVALRKRGGGGAAAPAEDGGQAGRTTRSNSSGDIWSN